MTTTSYQTNFATSSGGGGGFPPGGPARRQSSSSSSSDEEETRRTVTLPSQGGMSLHELNNRLEKYIQKINLHPDSPSFNITVETIRYQLSSYLQSETSQEFWVVSDC